MHKPDADFIWSDLSALDLGAALKFYADTFGWSMHKDDSAVGAPDKFGTEASTYYAAALGYTPIAGIFDMPEFFVNINMPSFWMSYISVTDIEATVEKARGIEGVIVEVEPSDFGSGQMALVRDPSGAGFTLFEGEPLSKKGDGTRFGEHVWNVLVTDDIENVRTFYEETFGFEFRPASAPNEYSLHNPSGTEIATVQELPAQDRGNKVFWMPIFAVDTLESFAASVHSAGGELVDTEAVGGTTWVNDNQGSFFGVMATGAKKKSGFSISSLWKTGSSPEIQADSALGDQSEHSATADQHSTQTAAAASPFSSSIKWRALGALALIWVASALNLQWLWGVLFLWFMLPDLRLGYTYLAEPVGRRENPITYWAIVGSFAALSLLMIATPFS